MPPPATLWSLCNAAPTVPPCGAWGTLPGLDVKVHETSEVQIETRAVGCNSSPQAQPPGPPVPTPVARLCPPPNPQSHRDRGSRADRNWPKLRSSSGQIGNTSVVSACLSSPSPYHLPHPNSWGLATPCHLRPGFTHLPDCSGGSPTWKLLSVPGSHLPRKPPMGIFTRGIALA